MYLRNEARRNKREQESYSRARETQESPFHDFPAKPAEVRNVRVVRRGPRRTPRRDLADHGEIAHVVHELAKHRGHPLYDRIYARCTKGFNSETLDFVERMQEFVEAGSP